MGGLGRASSRLEAGTEYCSQFAVGGVSVRLASEDDAAVTLVPALVPFRAETVSSDINIRIEWLDKLWPKPGLQLFDSGSVWRLFEDKAVLYWRLRSQVPGVFLNRAQRNSVVFGQRPGARNHISSGVGQHQCSEGFLQRVT